MSVRHELPDREAAAEAAAHHVVSRLADALAGQERATLALSGGTAPRPLFSRLAATRFPWDRVHFFWVDERCVPPAHPESNYRLALETMLEPLHIPERHVHRIRGELRPDDAARRYSEELQKFFGLEEGQMPQFDVLHLGLGTDGHMASLFPGDPLIENRTGIASAVYVEKLNAWRVTLLPAVLLAAHHTLFFVPGPEKAEAVRAVLTAAYDPLRWSAQVVVHHGRRVVWFLDEAAGKAA